MDITKNTVIGNVEIGKSSGDEINRDLDTMTEITEDRDFKTNINVESQTINYIKNPEKFKEDLQIAIIERKATGRTVVKTIDNVINGDKSQDIGDAERRSLIEIKEAKRQIKIMMEVLDKNEYMPDYTYPLIDSYSIDTELCDLLFETKSIYKKYT